MGDLATLAFALTPPAGLAACVVVHVTILRAMPALPRHHGFAASGVAGLLVVAGLAAVFGATSPGGWWTDGAGNAAAWALTYACLVYCYVAFFNLGETARRIRLLVELDAAGARGLTRDELLARYNASMIVDIRLGRMLTGGQIVRRGDRYVIGRPEVLWVSKTLVLLKLLLLGARSEFGGRPGPGSPAARA